MEFRVEAESKTLVASQDLAELSQWLVEDLGYDIARTILPSSAQEKDGGLLVGLAILSTTLTAINTVINVLNRWASKQKSKSKVLLIFPHETVALGDLSDAEIVRLSSESEKSSDAEVRITRFPT